MFHGKPKKLKLYSWDTHKVSRILESPATIIDKPKLGIGYKPKGDNIILSIHRRRGVLGRRIKRLRRLAKSCRCQLRASNIETEILRLGIEREKTFDLEDATFKRRRIFDEFSQRWVVVEDIFGGMF